MTAHILGDEIDTIGRFSSKAELYHYRWDYAPQAIQRIIKVARISAESSIADIGSGTGVLSRQFVEEVNRVFAVEPNPEMRQIAEEALGRFSSFESIAGVSDATTLPDHSIDIITVGRAIRWFMPKATKCEFLRILKPKGWLAILQTPGSDTLLNKALQRLRVPEYGWDMSFGRGRPEGPPVSFYYGSEDFLELSFSYSKEEGWQAFLGRLLSNSHAPGKDHPHYEKFENAVRNIFYQFSSNGRMLLNICTTLFLGQIKQH